MSKQNFISTSDRETAEKLIELGFEQIPSQGSLYVFLNNSKEMQITFNESEVDKTKVITTNKLIL